MADIFCMVCADNQADDTGAVVNVSAEPTVPAYAHPGCAEVVREQAAAGNLTGLDGFDPDNAAHRALAGQAVSDASFAAWFGYADDDDLAPDAIPACTRTGPGYNRNADGEHLLDTP